MNFLRLVREFLWIFPLLIQTTILCVLLTRKLWARFPFFSAYTVSVLSREFILLFLPYPGRPYAFVYWYGEIVTITFGLGAILETLRQLCAPYLFLRVVFRLAWGVVVCSSLLGIFMLISSHSDRALELVISAERSARLIQACSLIFVMMVVSRVGSSWREYTVGIAAGFGVYSALSLAIWELCARLRLVSDNSFIILNSAAYNLAAVIWGIYFLRPHPGWRSAELPKPNLTQWREALTAYTQQWHRQ
jgi:hypothetical protein